MKQIGIQINKDGKILIATDGFTGDACLKEAEELLKELQKVGVEANIEKISFKEEYYAKEKNHAHNKV